MDDVARVNVDDVARVNVNDVISKSPFILEYNRLKIDMPMTLLTIGLLMERMGEC